MKIVGSSSVSVFSMTIYRFLILAILLTVTHDSSCSVVDNKLNNVTDHESPSFRTNRTSFPTSFIFGTASSSYQYEGAANEDGRGPSIWDTWTHKFPEKISDRSNGDVAVDSYHRYKEDVGIMKEMGVDAYRFSISWSRLLPNGTLRGGVNQQGITYYNNLINELLSKGVQPFVTLFHWDLPQPLEDEYAGFLSPRIVNDFKDYAELCYKEFGDRVKYWITFNEPWTYSSVAYAVGRFAPGRCSKWVGNCTLGNSGTEPYTVAHHQILAHAVAAKLYKDNYQTIQKGNIGITLGSNWMVPVSSSKLNQDAAFRALDFMYGWFMDPLTYGEYPESMRSLVGDRLPKFSEDESKFVKGSCDFIGLNYYTANYAEHVPSRNNYTNVIPSYTNDAQTKLTTQRNGIPIGAKSASPWLFVYPQGFRNLLHYTKRKYKNPVIYITENGISESNDPNLSLEEALKDDLRVMYYDHHLFYLQKAIKEGVDVRGYFAWSLLDNFEWSSGYTVRFGIHYVDYKNGLKRYPKSSATCFKSFLKK
ncbi:hypothetical protein MKW94_011147 [Papaver nudicaule]|uniref:Uncharacterized protein n=1 Tax=Papaver nudicaule TaxID=74823 RepID=A0AA41RTZ1_PAPNU|nr:hypothetical protein [Papaver nudicaule]